MRIGLFGGSFDPIHNGHLLLAECCREQCQLDSVWFLATATPPHKKDAKISPAERRIEMIELAIAGNAAFSLCRHEVDRGGVNYTVDTLEFLKKQQPNSEFFFPMGGDMFLDLPHWRNAARVCELALPVVVYRPGAGHLDFSVLNSIASSERIEQIRRQMVEMPEMGISSSEIRRRVAAGQTIRYQVPRAVEMYIQTHGLYRSKIAVEQ